MTREQAKEILSAYRPDGADAMDPFFADALEAAAVDPILGQWLSEQQERDRQIAGALTSIAVPAQLQARLRSLDTGQTHWWNRKLRPAELGLAAAIALILGLAGFWLHARTDQTFASMRNYVIQQTWSGKRHVDLETSNLAEIRRFIAANDLRGDFKLPPELAAMRPHGCTLLHVHGHAVPFICFVEGSKHLHLIVMETNLCSEVLPADQPDFERWRQWTTATWTQGPNTFVLTGLRPLDFVKKFRKEGQWDLGG